MTFALSRGVYVLIKIDKLHRSQQQEAARVILLHGRPLQMSGQSFITAVREGHSGHIIGQLTLKSH